LLFENRKMSEVKPYIHSEGTKKQQVEQMFDNISANYDMLNHLLSMQIDKGWRNKVVKKVQELNPKTIIDIATGTGDLAIELAKNTKAEITGYDLSQKMLDVGIQKVNKLQLNKQIKMIKGDAENIPFNANSFDVATVSFGARNFENLEAGLSEMRRVLNSNGKIFILEFSKPEGFFAPFFIFYFKYILPKIGQLISKDSRAYTYLPDSVEAFPYGEKLKNILEKIGFSDVKFKKLTFGIASIYEGTK